MGDDGLKYPRLAAWWAKSAVLGVNRIFARLVKAGDYEGKLAEEADHWAGGERGNTWLDSQVIKAAVDELISGDPDVYWLLHFKNRYVSKPYELALNLGCGTGGLERNAFSIGLAEAFDSYDISPRAIEECERAGSAGGRTFLSGEGRINCKAADINKIQLESGRYDAAFAVNILHHLTELEHVFDEVFKALKPGGLFVIHEYVGPRRFQWSDARLELINAALIGLPRRYRRNRRKGWGVKRRVYRPLMDETNPDSPFEAARSDEIIPLMEKRFECVERIDLGGALLHQLLEAIVANFDEDLESDRRILMDLWKMEKDLMARGDLESDFVYAVFRKPGGD